MREIHKNSFFNDVQKSGWGNAIDHLEKDAKVLEILSEPSSKVGLALSGKNNTRTIRMINAFKKINVLTTQISDTYIKRVLLGSCEQKVTEITGNKALRQDIVYFLIHFGNIALIKDALDQNSPLGKIIDTPINPLIFNTFSLYSTTGSRRKLHRRLEKLESRPGIDLSFDLDKY